MRENTGLAVAIEQFSMSIKTNKKLLTALFNYVEGLAEPINKTISEAIVKDERSAVDKAVERHYKALTGTENGTDKTVMLLITKELDRLLTRLEPKSLNSLIDSLASSAELYGISDSEISTLGATYFKFPWLIALRLMEVITLDGDE